MSVAPAPPDPPDPRINLADYLHHHYLPRKTPGWAEGTRAFRSWAVDSVLIPDLGHRPVADLSLAELERWVGWRAITPFATSGNTPKRATLDALLNTLGAALRLAMLDGLVPVNATKGIRLPRDISDPVCVWTGEQVRIFLDATAHTRYATLWRVLFATGLRRGEALGLTWADLDVTRGTVTVRRSLQSHSRSGAYHYGPPKTPRSRRTMSIDRGTIEQLGRWRAKQNAEFDKRGESVTSTDSIFTTASGDPMLPCVVSDAWRAAMKRTGLPRMRLHDIRHTHLSHLLREGEPIAHVSARAGHGTPYQTLTTYAHLIPGDDERTAARAGTMFSGDADAHDAQTGGHDGPDEDGGGARIIDWPA